MCRDHHPLLPLHLPDDLVWDALYSEFAGRHGLYERNYAGSKDIQRLNTLQFARMRGEVDAYKGLVDQAMSDYDANGWVNAVWNA